MSRRLLIISAGIITGILLAGSIRAEAASSKPHPALAARGSGISTYTILQYAAARQGEAILR